MSNLSNLSNFTAMAGGGGSAVSVEDPWTMVFGTVLGLVMCVLIDSSIYYFHFSKWINDPGNHTIPPAESFLHAAQHGLLAMLFVGGILTDNFSTMDMENTALIKYYGYNNICVFLDSAPSTYVMPVMWFFTGYLVVRFCIEDSRRIHFLTREHCSELHKKWAYFTNLFFAVSTALFSLCLAVSPDESMVLHTFPFMFVILSLAMVSANYLHQERGGTKAYTVIVISFVILSVTKFLLTSIALITVGDVRVNPWVARVIDAAWTIGLMIAPFARPPSTDLGHKLESSEARQAAATQVVYWSWLFIFLIPYILVGTLLQMLSSLLGMGHFFPYMKYFSGGWTGFLTPLVEKHEKTVFPANISCPVLMMLDASSAQAAILANTNCMNDAHGATVSLTKSLFGGQEPNFVRSGQEAVDSRAFMAAVLDLKRDNPEHQTRFREAKYAMGRELSTWVAMPSHTLQQTTLDELVARAITVFMSHLFFGKVLEHEVVSDIWKPLVGVRPAYPSIPTWLLPMFYQGKVSSNFLFQEMQNSPNWDTVIKPAMPASMSNEAACGNLLVAMTFNAAGSAGALMMPFFVLPAIPGHIHVDTQANLSSVSTDDSGDSALLNSMAWEMLRFCGPSLSRKVSRELLPDAEGELVPTTVTCSKGEEHAIPEGTVCYTHLGMIMRDEKFWTKPHNFKLDRFVPTLTQSDADKTSWASKGTAQKTKEGGKEPLPTLGFGYPLGTLGNEAVFRDSHGCSFGRLLQPMMKFWLKMLVQDFNFVMLNVPDLKVAEGDNMAVEIPPEMARGGKPGADMVPKVDGGAYLASFEYASEAVKTKYAPVNVTVKQPNPLLKESDDDVEAK